MHWKRTYEKNRTKKGTREIALSIDKKHNSNIHSCHVEKLVEEGLIVKTPPKEGPTN